VERPIKRKEFIERRLQNDRRMLDEWRIQRFAEHRAELAGKRIGFVAGLLCGMLGATVLIIAASDILWTFR
jgi:hypothetical protein